MISCHRYKLTLLCLALLGIGFLAACTQTEEADVASKDKPEKVVPVSVETTRLQDLTEHFTLPANLEAWEDLMISAEIAGPVNKINFQEGQSVRTGQVLLEIDPQTLQGSLAREEKNYSISARKLERYKKLNADGLVSDQELDNLQNSVTAAEIALRNTRLQLNKCFPQAPVNGVVDLHYVDRGEYVDPGKPLLRIVQVDKLKVIADVPEKDVPFLKVGQQVAIIPAVINEQAAQTVTGQIEHIAFSADQSTRTYRTKIAIDNRERKLRPGMIVRTRFVRQELAQVMLVPLYAVLDRNGEKLVFVEEEGYAKQIEVQTGNSIGQGIIVKSGLERGQRLIVKGQQLLIDGAKVSVRED